MIFHAVLVEIDRIRQRRKHEGEKHKDDDMDYKKKMKEATKKLMPITVSALGHTRSMTIDRYCRRSN